MPTIILDLLVVALLLTYVLCCVQSLRAGSDEPAESLPLDMLTMVVLVPALLLSADAGITDQPGIRWGCAAAMALTAVTILRKLYRMRSQPARCVTVTKPGDGRV
ncbi:hypothetical protein [Nocardia brasiliensis]|uniref:hypothetical protein n=1 Tax=Nocardia brasiliensis TaxID=37326 RepID=UPI00245832A5|nr:hypothetical protein [Nocardia brasiliensis]